MERDGNAIRLNLPADEAAVRALRIGDQVLLSGTIVTARDVAHKYMVESSPEWLEPLLGGSVIYHCGPVVARRGDRWEIVAAGPTTSIREEPYEDKVIERYGVRGVIGKGGMGPKTLAALRAHGAVYLHAVGGAATLIAESIREVVDVHKLDEFGTPEAFWVLRVVDFPVVVTMDSHGGSLHEQVLEASNERRRELLGL